MDINGIGIGLNAARSSGPPVAVKWSTAYCRSHEARWTSGPSVDVDHGSCRTHTGQDAILTDASTKKNAWIFDDFGITFWQHQKKQQKWKGEFEACFFRRGVQVLKIAIALFDGSQDTYMDAFNKKNNFLL